MKSGFALLCLGALAWIWMGMEGGTARIRTTSAAKSVSKPSTSPDPAAPASVARPEPSSAPGIDASLGVPLPPEQVRTLAVQLALIHAGISPGPVDGRSGTQTEIALRAFQFHRQIEVTGQLDAPTLAALNYGAPPFRDRTITPTDLASIGKVATTWLEKSKQEFLPYESVLEMVAEESQAFQSLVRQINPGVDWDHIRARQVLRLPNPVFPPVQGKASLIRIKLADKALLALDAEGRLLAQYPCSIARRVEKRPVGELHVVTFAEHPNYRFDPQIFPESEEGRRLGRVLMIPPGPNNPVGLAWIGLDKPGYGIHGTPDPEKVGRTESHGCFRLANWNVLHLVQLVRTGLPVFVEP